MKKSFVLLSLILSSSAFAGTKAFSVEAQIFVGSEVVADTHVLSVAGESVAVTQKSATGQVTILEVCADGFSNAQTGHGILLGLTLSTLVNGQKVVIAKSHVMTLPGEATDVNLGPMSTETGAAQLRTKIYAQPIHSLQLGEIVHIVSESHVS